MYDSFTKQLHLLNIYGNMTKQVFKNVEICIFMCVHMSAQNWNLCPVLLYLWILTSFVTHLSLGRKELCSDILAEHGIIEYVTLLLAQNLTSRCPLQL